MTGRDQIDHLQRVLVDHPDDHQARGSLIEALLSLNETDEASAEMDTLVGLIPESEWVLVLGARVSEAAGDNLKAARYRRRALALAETREAIDRSASPHPSRFVSPLDAIPRLRLVPGGATHAPALHPERHLEDIKGLSTVKRRLGQVIAQARTKTNTSSEHGWLGGVLMYGPPSCGKAFSAEVVAGELDATIHIFDLADSWLRSVLESEINNAMETKGERSVLFFDNLDVPEDGGTMLFSSIAETLDNYSARDSAAPVILGAATLPWLVSTSIVTSGRLGDVLLVLPPDAPARHQYLSDLFSRDHEVEPGALEWLVDHTQGHSFGDMEELALIAVENTDGTGMIDRSVLRHARQSVGPSSSGWLTAAGHHALMNENGGLYDDLLTYLQVQQRH